MQRHFSVIGYTLTFGVALELLVLYPDWYQSSFLLLAGVLLLLQWSVIGGFSKKSTLPFFFGFFSWALLFFIDSPTEQQIFTVLSTVLFFWMLWSYRRWRGGHLAGFTKSGISSVTIATAFLFFSVLSATLINYAFPIWIFMILMGVGAYGLTYQYLFGITEEKRRVSLYSTVMGIFFSQLGWVIQFWPFGYLTIGVILLIVYYVLWDFLGSYMEGVFTRRRAWGNFLLLVALVLLVLVTTRWTPVG